METVTISPQTKVSGESADRLHGLLRRDGGAGTVGASSSWRLSRRELDRIAMLGRIWIPQKEIAYLTGTDERMVSYHLRKSRGLKRAKRNPIPEDVGKEIIALRGSGKKHRRIAKELGIERDAVTRYLLKHGHKTRDARKQLSERKRREIIRLHDKGIMQKEIAEELKVAESTVSRYLKQRKKEEFERIGKEIIRLREEKMKVKDIAERLGLKRWKVSRYLSRLGRGRKGIKCLPEETVQKITQLGDELASREIGTRLELPESTVRSRLLRAGKRKREARPKISQEKEERMRRLFELGLKPQKIARIVEVAVSTVYRHRRPGQE